MGVPVVDETGLKGSYDFSIRYARPDPVGNTDELTLFAALLRELGLRLEKGKGPVETLVVDHIEVKPTENYRPAVPPPPGAVDPSGRAMLLYGS